MLYCSQILSQKHRKRMNNKICTIVYVNLIMTVYINIIYNKYSSFSLVNELYSLILCGPPPILIILSQYS